MSQFYCEECGVSATSEENLAQHRAGTKHQKRLRQLGLRSSVLASSSPGVIRSSFLPPITTGGSYTSGSIIASGRACRSSMTASGGYAPVVGSNADPFFCNVCRVAATSAENFQQHLDGQQHAKKVRRTGMPYSGVSTSPTRLPALVPIRRTSSHPELKLEATTLLAQPTVQELRHYQRELYGQCMQSNRVVYLPTGMGKTLVGAAVLSHMLQLNPTRQVVFIVDRVLLVVQQSAYLREQLDCVTVQRHRVYVAGLCGDKRKLDPDMPACSERRHDVIVATAGCYLNLLQEKTLCWNDVSCLVLDEAHHCVKKHPFNELVQTYYHNPGSHRPRLVGLTASPVGELTLDGTRWQLALLLSRMDAKLSAVVHHRQSYENHLKRAQLRCVVVNEDDDVGNVLVKEKTASMSNNQARVDPTYTPSVGSVTPEIRCALIQTIGQYLTNLMPHNPRCSANLLEEIEMADIKASFFHTFVAELFLLVTQLLEAEFAGETSHIYLLHLQIVTQGWLDVRAGLGCSELLKLCGYETPYSFLPLSKQHQLPNCAKLIGLLQRCNKESTVLAHHQLLATVDVTSPAMVAIPAMIALPTTQVEEEVDDFADEILPERARDNQVITELLGLPWDSSRQDQPVALVLVQLRDEAHRLCALLNRNSKLRSKGVRSLTIVGQGSGGTGPGMTVHQQAQALKALRSGECSIAVCTSVAEEGLDLPACSLVIQTQPPPHVTSLVQSWGRARARCATFVVICYVENQQREILNLLKREENMETVACEVMAKQGRA